MSLFCGPYTWSDEVLICRAVHLPHYTKLFTVRMQRVCGIVFFFRACGEPIIFFHTVTISRNNYYIAFGERHYHAHTPRPIIFRSILLKWRILLGETGTNTGTGTDTGTNFWKYTGTGTGTGTNFLK